VIHGAALFFVDQGGIDAGGVPIVFLSIVEPRDLEVIHAKVILLRQGGSKLIVGYRLFGIYIVEVVAQIAVRRGLFSVLIASR
jgi:hypothetical protein